MIKLAGGLVLLWLSACASVERPPSLDGARIVDLSHPFNEHTVFWPTAKGFALERVAHGRTAAGYFYAANNFSMAEHGGTHMDAPIHFAEGRRTCDQVPLEQLLAPLCLVDVREACARDRDHVVTMAELESWEARHRRIRAGDAVVFWTGWSARWPDRLLYLGDDKPGDASNLHFPGISAEAARWLVDRRVDLVGLDTASLDHGPSRDFIAHQILNGADIPGLENLTHLDRLPPRGAWIVALPIKLEGGSGGPCRVMALLP
jgi:kynurenine formamidase